MCLNFLIVKIGCDNDNTIKIDTQQLTTVVNTTINTIADRAESNARSINTVDVTNNGLFDCPAGFTIKQVPVDNVTTIDKVNNTQATEINTAITDKVQSKLSQQQVQGVLGFLNSIGQAGSIKNGTDITNQVKESVRNAVTNSIITEAVNGAFDVQTLKLTNNGIIEGGSCNIIQQDILNVRSTNIASNAQNNLQNDTFLNSLLNYVKQTQKSADLSWVKWIFIAVIAVAVLLALGLVLYFVFGGSKSKPKSQSKQQLAEELRRKILEKKEGGIASKSNLEGLEKSAEARVGEGGGEGGGESGQTFSRLGEKLGKLGEKFGKRFE